MRLCGLGALETAVWDPVFGDVGVEEGCYDADAGLSGGRRVRR